MLEVYEEYLWRDQTVSSRFVEEELRMFRVEGSDR